jgi:hypothetical protein
MSVLVGFPCLQITNIAAVAAHKWQSSFAWKCSQIGCHLLPAWSRMKIYKNKIEIYFKMFQMLEFRVRFVN